MAVWGRAIKFSYSGTVPQAYTVPVRIGGMRKKTNSATEDENEDAFSVPEGSEASEEHVSGMSGEALVWRCSVCGEMGEVDEIADGCPSCGAPETDLDYRTED